MGKLKSLIEEMKYFIEDHKWFKWVVSGMIVVIVILLIINTLGGTSKDDTGKGGTNDSTSESVKDGEDETSLDDTNLVGVSKETLHILTNPEQYDEDEISRAYQDSLTTFDDTFVEEHVYMNSGLSNGIYLYHEKADEDYREIALLAREVNELGVPLFFYTPQSEQSIARVANHTEVLEDGKVSVKAMVVRDYKVAEKMEDIEEVKTYLEGVISENK